MSTSQSSNNQTEETKSNWRSDLPSSIVVFLVALPLCMGIAIASGVPVSAGLATGIIAGIVVGSLSGCALQVSGPAAGLTVIVYEVVTRHGLEMLGLVVLLAGIFQLAAATLHLGQWFRAVSPAVVNGMLAGIGVIIFASQFHVMLDDKPKESALENLATIPDAITKAWKAPSFTEKDRRHVQRESLMQLAELHRQQEVIHEKLTERLPNHKETVVAPGSVQVDDLIERQESLIAKTQVFVQESLTFFEEYPERESKLLAAEDRAIQAMSVSLAFLRSDDPSQALKVEKEASNAILAIEGVYKNHEMAAGVGILTILTLILWATFSFGKLKIIPGPLLAILVGTSLAAFLELPVLYVEIPDSISEELHLLSWATLQDAPWGGVIVSAIVLAIVASAETLLSATAVDQMHNGPRTRYDKELFSQGVGNMVAGFVGGLPMTGVIVRSSANVHAGAKTRMSAILHGVWLLVFVVFLGTILRMIPTSALAAILVYIGYKLCDWKKVQNLMQFGWGEVAVYFVTVIVIVVEDLLIGVAVGLGLSMLKLMFSVGKLNVTMNQLPNNIVDLKLSGASTFLKIPSLANQLELIPPGTEVNVDISELNYIDHACVSLLTTWGNQHTQTGGTVNVDWEDLKLFARNGVHESQTPVPVSASIDRQVEIADPAFN